MKKPKNLQRRKVRRTMFTLVNLAVPLTFLLFLWTHAAEASARYTPDYPMEDISAYSEQAVLTEEDYFLLFRQTGLTQVAVDALWAENKGAELLAMQERFFAEPEVCCEGNLVLFHEVLEEPRRAFAKTGADAEVSEFMPVLEDGDILITFNSHFLGWRNGHAAIVTDAERGLVLEALTLGKNSAVLSLNGWRDCPSFAVLRLTEASVEQRKSVAKYAEEVLTDVPYRLTAGIWEGIEAMRLSGNSELEVGNIVQDMTQDTKQDAMQGEGDSVVSGTHCAHLVWYAYKQFGYDLDSDGGVLVTPRDLYDSPLLELVQVYGMEPYQ